MTHFGSSEELGLGVSLGLGGGWDWLKNSRTCNTKYNRHACINTKTKKTESLNQTSLTKHVKKRGESCHLAETG